LQIHATVRIVNPVNRRLSLMPAKDMAAYMRDRRARQKADREARERSSQIAPSALARPAIPIGRPLTIEERRDDAVLDAIEGRGGKAEWTGDRWREVTPAPRPSLPAPSPTPAPRYVPPAPKSMFAVGGRPGTDPAIQGYDPTFAPHVASAVRRQANVATFEAKAAASINLLAREVASLKREVAELKQAGGEAASRDPRIKSGEDMPIWAKGLMALASGMTAYIQAAERARREAAQGRGFAS
jgi:hypothetical protein